MGSTSSTLLVLSLIELLIGLTKTPLAVYLSGDNSWTWKLFISIALLVECALCISVNVIAIKATLQGGKESIESRLLIVAAVVDLGYFCMEAYLSYIIGLIKKDDGTGATIKSRWKVSFALFLISLLSLPLIVIFFRTKNRKMLSFSSNIEKTLVVILVVVSASSAIISLYLLRFTTRQGPQLLFFAVPLGTSVICAIIGACTRESAVLLSALLVLFPPTASACFVFVKTMILDELWQSNLRKQNPHVYSESTSQPEEMHNREQSAI